MKKDNKDQILERIVVPGSKKNNEIVANLIEQTTSLQPRNFKFKNRSLTGFFVDLEQYKTFANSIIDDPDRYRSIRIFSHDNRGYHLLGSKDFRLITKRSNKKLDKRLNKTLDKIKSHIAINQNRE